MKKLILISLIFSNLVMAEDLNLLCEGEMRTYRNNVLENTSKEKQTLQVKDDSVVIDSITYKSKIFDYGAIKGSSKYLIDDSQITIETSQISNECDTALLNVKLNRTSGIIESTSKRIGACDGSSFTSSSEFKGKCK